MLGIFGIFGRSQDIQSLDRAFRAAGLHPRLVPDAVKITVLKQLKESNRGAAPAPDMAAELIAYCALGPNGFADHNGLERTEAMEARLVRAIEDGGGLDARLVLLLLQAKLANPSVIARYDLRME